MPGYGSVLGVQPFGLEETQAYGRAEDMGRRAVERNPRDLGRPRRFGLGERAASAEKL